ncbi:peptidylprolyl isomerase [Rhizobacter sp. Root1221]|uniref:peptidylprolyl isomerase n=1 Tax=Rhizobacter sp. Root1221 TaxID=1736433 RepID=UPI0006FA10F3|nr:peptidylprolyl isomerase [Rhizobacter sp. Root1221]KQV87955.1 peptidylprolyl isomerase [Rhizobacter sp. Root1221]
MTTLVKIDDGAISVAEFLQTLKLNGQFEGLIEQLVRDRITVQAAKKQGLRVSEAEIQERADQFRRVRGLHRASDTNKYLDALHVGLEEFEAFLIDGLYQEKMMAHVCSEQTVQTYFKLNSPRFDSIEVSHIVLDAEGKAKEMISVLADDPDSFDEMAREHSIADTREHGGLIGKVLRGSLRTDIEAKVFNAAVGELLGPFASPDRTVFEIFRVNAKHPARLDDDTATEVRRLLHEEWLRARAQEHVIEAC